MILLTKKLIINKKGNIARRNFPSRGLGLASQKKNCPSASTGFASGKLIYWDDRSYI